MQLRFVGGSERTCRIRYTAEEKTSHLYQPEKKQKENKSKGKAKKKTNREQMARDPIPLSKEHGPFSMSRRSHPCRCQRAILLSDEGSYFLFGFKPTGGK